MQPAYPDGKQMVTYLQVCQAGYALALEVGRHSIHSIVPKDAEHILHQAGNCNNNLIVLASILSIISIQRFCNVQCNSRGIMF